MSETRWTALDAPGDVWFYVPEVEECTAACTRDNTCPVCGGAERNRAAGLYVIEHHVVLSTRRLWTPDSAPAGRLRVLAGEGIIAWWSGMARSMRFDIIAQREPAPSGGDDTQTIALKAEAAEWLVREHGFKVRASAIPGLAGVDEVAPMRALRNLLNVIDLGDVKAGSAGSCDSEKEKDFSS